MSVDAHLTVAYQVAVNWVPSKCPPSSSLCSHMVQSVHALVCAFCVAWKMFFRPASCLLAHRSHMEQYVRIEDHTAMQQERDNLNSRLLAVLVGSLVFTCVVC